MGTAAVANEASGEDRPPLMSPNGRHRYKRSQHAVVDGAEP